MTPMHDWAPRTSAFMLSVLLHAAVLLSLQAQRLVPMRLPEAPLLLPVTVLPPPPKTAPSVPEAPPPEPSLREPPQVKIPQAQIVSPPDAGSEVPPANTRLLSDRDNTVQEEMVRRGAPRPSADTHTSGERQYETRKSGGGETQKAARQEAPQMASLPGLDRLLPSALQLAGEDYGRTDAGAGAARERTELRAERRHPDVWLPTSETFGTLDFLPDVREGDITLLNTKAERFAPFVRRVALRVFQNLLIALRRELSYRGVTARESVTVEAVMDRRGEMSSMEVTARSPGIALATDRKLQQALTNGFFDRNPPPGAQGKDGNIHFLLRTQVATLADQTGRPLGYRVMFEAGLL